MNQKLVKQIRRKVRQEENSIKINGLSEFFEYSSIQPLRKRFALALKILFKVAV